MYFLKRCMPFKILHFVTMVHFFYSETPTNNRKISQINFLFSLLFLRGTATNFTLATDIFGGRFTLQQPFPWIVTTCCFETKH